MRYPPLHIKRDAPQSWKSNGDLKFQLLQRYPQEPQPKAHELGSRTPTRTMVRLQNLDIPV